MLREVSNMQIMSNKQLEDNVFRTIQGRLPRGWGIRRPQDGNSCSSEAELTVPDDKGVLIRIEVRASMDPRGVVQLKNRLMSDSDRLSDDNPVVVISRYLSPATRQKLIEAGFNFMDLTGNARIVLVRPAVFIELSGAARSPFREDRKVRIFKGPKVGRIVRTLVDFRDTPGVRELAVRAGVDAGYLSRVLASMEKEALVDRGRRGRIERLDWAGLLRRWAVDSPLESRCELVTFIEPRGLKSVLTKLASIDMRYAVTGSLAAARTAPVAPARLGMIYVDDIEAASESLALRPAESGANVVLARPVDEVVYRRCLVVDGVTYAASAQVAADLLTSSGRGPAEGEELLNWMGGNEGAWRG